jgi:chorismate mutase/prephenate dehydrogenase
MSLDELRSELSDVDRQLISLVAERQRIVSAIGRDKLSSGRATRDYEREKTVLSNARAHAERQRVDPDLAEQIMSALIRSSLTSQERDRVAASGKGDGQRVLVIGGAGKMGRWFVDFFRSQGFSTTVADTQKSEAGIGAGEAWFADWRDAGVDFDIIVVATPLAISANILVELAERQPRGLVFDIGSLKTPLRQGLQSLAAAGCQVCSVHPMFGPDTDLLSGRHLIFVDVGVPEATQRARDLFSATMVEQLDMDVDDHDRLIAYVLGLSHALNIAFFTALAESGEAAPRLAQLSSTTFDSQLLVSAAVARDNPRLYFEIQALNDYGLDPLDALCESAQRIRRAVADNDEGEFVRLMENGRSYLKSRR